MTETARYTVAEEIANGITHGIGVVASVTGLIVLLAAAARTGCTRGIVASAVFGTSMIALFASSTLYHAIPSPRSKRWLRVLDHSAIYLLIAGTYTPFTLITLRGPWGWSLFGVVWGVAILGVALQGSVLRRVPKLEVALYLVLGWVVVVAARPLVAALPPGGLTLLAGGGLAYTAGVVFYLWRRLPYHHAIWHLFVLVGVTLHYFAVLLYVLPSCR